MLEGTRQTMSDRSGPAPQRARCRVRGRHVAGADGEQCGRDERRDQERAYHAGLITKFMLCSFSGSSFPFLRASLGAMVLLL